MAQSVSCGTFKWEEGRGWSTGLSVNPDNLASCGCYYCVASIVFPYLSCTLQLSGFPLENDIRHPLLKAPNRRAASLGYCRESGPMCWVFKVCNTGLGTGDSEFFFSFRLLNPTSSGEEPATNIIRWIFKRTKAPLRFFILPVEKKAEQKPHPA